VKPLGTRAGKEVLQALHAERTALGAQDWTSYRTAEEAALAALQDCQTNPPVLEDLEAARSILAESIELMRARVEQHATQLQSMDRSARRNRKGVLLDRQA
jgi:L-amino acid N-acyltransferase YncA